MSARPTFTGDERGATAVEFALILPAFVLLVLGSIATADLGFTIASMNYAVEDAARCAAVRTSVCSDSATTIAYARARYAGLSISPVFTYSTAACGSTVSATATYSMSLIPNMASIPISVSSCRAAA